MHTVTYNIYIYKRQKKPKGQSTMDNPEKLAKLDTQDEDKENNTEIHNTMCYGHHYAQTQIT